MKNSKQTALTCATFLLFLIFTGCRLDEKAQPCPDCPCETVLNDNYNNGIILPTKAHKLYENYKNRRVGLIENYERAMEEKDKDPKKPSKEKAQAQHAATESSSDDSKPGKFTAARYVSYDYKDIKAYLAYIENEAKLSGEELTTLRFYFANYADEKKYNDGKPVVHPKQNTIMMSPTINKNGGDHMFFTVDGTDGKREVVLLDDEFNPIGPRKSTEQTPNTKNEASFLPGFFSASSAPFYAERSTTKNEGHSQP
ncbi:hypothetical protein [Zobellia uliginosa]|uniref:hypothetical protein n=1 Tax=Zobellia uliginosa TaxID=143224 RepID=UPI0026E213BD|nr:hypothetical protein [Zobellia uliginosa]MDO6519789.1 hypothetical protein [Zobellia uliginosa]